MRRSPRSFQHRVSPRFLIQAFSHIFTISDVIPGVDVMWQEDSTLWQNDTPIWQEAA